LAGDPISEGRGGEHWNSGASEGGGLDLVDSVSLEPQLDPSETFLGNWVLSQREFDLFGIDEFEVPGCVGEEFVVVEGGVGDPGSEPVSDVVGGSEFWVHDARVLGLSQRDGLVVEGPSRCASNASMI
jgi:hypothetical protein